MATATQKRCTKCGKDVSQAKRLKDASGNYYCEPCVQAAQSGSTVRACANCGLIPGALQQLWEWQGHKVCTTCRDALRHEAELREEEQRKIVAAESERVDQEDDALKAKLREDRTRQRAALRCVVWPVLAPLAAFGGWAISPFFGVAVLVGGGVAFFRLLKQYRTITGPSAGRFGADLNDAFRLLRGRWPVVRGCSMLLVAVAALFIGAGLAGDKYGMVWAWVTGGVMLIPVVIAGAFLENVKRKECPLCWSRTAVFDGIEDLGTVAVTTRTTEKATVHEGLNTFGLPLATIKIPVEKTRLVRRQAQNWHCTSCGHRWRN